METQKKLATQNFGYRAIWKRILGRLAVHLLFSAFVLVFLLYMSVSATAALAAMGRSDGARSSPYSSERQEISGLPRFERIRAELGTVSVQYGAQPSVFIEDAWHLDTLYVDDEGTLHIEDTHKFRIFGGRIFGRSGRISGAQRDRVAITLPVLTEIRAVGVGTVDVGPGFSGESIDISISGTAPVRLEQADFGSLRLDLHGTGSFLADASRLEYLDAEISGTGSVDVRNLAPQARLRIDSRGTGNFVLRSEGEGSIGEAKVRASGTGGVTLRDFVVGASLSVRLSGVGYLRYGGEPNIVESDISGIARLESVD